MPTEKNHTQPHHQQQLQVSDVQCAVLSYLLQCAGTASAVFVQNNNILRYDDDMLLYATIPVPGSLNSNNWRNELSRYSFTLSIHCARYPPR